MALLKGQCYAVNLFCVLSVRVHIRYHVGTQGPSDQSEAYLGNCEIGSSPARPGLGSGVGCNNQFPYLATAPTRQKPKAQSDDMVEFVRHTHSI